MIISKQVCFRPSGHSAIRVIDHEEKVYYLAGDWGSRTIGWWVTSEAGFLEDYCLCDDEIDAGEFLREQLASIPDGWTVAEEARDIVDYLTNRNTHQGEENMATKITTAKPTAKTETKAPAKVAAKAPAKTESKAPVAKVEKPAAKAPVKAEKPSNIVPMAKAKPAKSEGPVGARAGKYTGMTIKATGKKYEGRTGTRRAELMEALVKSKTYDEFIKLEVRGVKTNANDVKFGIELGLITLG